MTESLLMQLSPDIWSIIFKYVGFYDYMNAKMASSQLATHFVTKNHRYWRVDCCKLAQRTLDMDSWHSIYCYKTSLNNFIKGLKHGLAPISAQRVIFDFCKHERRPVDQDNYEASKIDEDCPTQRVAELFGLLSAQRVTISVHLGDARYVSTICNESLFRAMLYYSIKKLPNAAVYFRMKLPCSDRWTQHHRSYFMTVRDPSMSSQSVETNLQLALSATSTTQLKRNNLWDFAKIRYVPEFPHDGIYQRYFPKLRCLTCSRTFDCLNPDQLLEQNPQCEWPTARYWNNPNMQPIFEYPGTTFYFDYVPDASARHCTKISAHAQDYEWIMTFLHLNDGKSVFEHVKLFEFHHTGPMGRRFRHAPQTPSTVTTIVLSCLKQLPNLETVTFMFDPENLKDIARPELLTKGQTLRTDFCQHCQQNVQVLEIDSTAIRDSPQIRGSYELCTFLDSFKEKAK